MQIAFTDEQDALRRELRAVLRGPDDPRGAGGDGDRRRRVRRRGRSTSSLVRQMGQDGWLGIGWPKEYGGQDRSMVEQLIFMDEASLASAPVPFLTVNTVGPTLMHFGTDEQRKEFLPKILAGQMHFSIGYSEPEAGTDLASLTTRAVRDGDEYVINGQKMWTSLIQYADYVWLAVRTDPEAPKHKGLSMLLVPTDAPGFSLDAGAHRWPASPPAPPSTRTCGCRRPTWSAARTRAGSSSPTSSTTSGWPSARPPTSSTSSPTCADGPTTPSCPTAGGSSTRSGCRCTWPGSTPRPSSSSSSTGRSPGG